MEGGGGGGEGREGEEGSWSWSWNRALHTVCKSVVEGLLTSCGREGGREGGHSPVHCMLIQEQVPGSIWLLRQHRNLTTHRPCGLLLP